MCPVGQQSARWPGPQRARRPTNRDFFCFLFEPGALLKLDQAAIVVACRQYSYYMIYDHLTITRLLDPEGLFQKQTEVPSYARNVDRFPNSLVPKANLTNPSSSAFWPYLLLSMDSSSVLASFGFSFSGSCFAVSTGAFRNLNADILP
jgi:hypothetical protein